MDTATGGVVAVSVGWNFICGTDLGVGRTIKGYILACSCIKHQPLQKIAYILPFYLSTA